MKARFLFSVKALTRVCADEKARTEEQWAKSASIKFVNVPINNRSRPKEAQIEEVLDLINSLENQMVFVHCKRGKDRTETVVAVYRIARRLDGKTSQTRSEEKRFRLAAVSDERSY